MPEAKKKADLFHSLLAFTIIGALILWAVMIFTHKGEERLDQACKPVEFTTQLLHEVTFALIGSQPSWTLYVQRYLMTGCYYSFSVLLSEKMGDTNPFGAPPPAEPAAPVGGIHD
jgi:hypothetical protein